jgi:integrase
MLSPQPAINVSVLHQEVRRVLISFFSKSLALCALTALILEFLASWIVALSEENEAASLKPQTQARIWDQLQHFLDWCVQSGELEASPWEGLAVKAKPEINPHGALSDTQVALLVNNKDAVLHNILLFCLLTGLRSGEACGLLADDIVSKGNLGRFVRVAPNDVRQLKSRAAQREVPLHSILEYLLDTALPTTGRLFPTMTVDVLHS